MNINIYLTGLRAKHLGTSIEVSVHFWKFDIKII